MDTQQLHSTGLQGTTCTSVQAPALGSAMYMKCYLNHCFQELEHLDNNMLIYEQNIDRHIPAARVPHGSVLVMYVVYYGIAVYVIS